jgi:hypothetical protein
MEHLERIVDSGFYTLLLQAGSHYVDAATRQRVLEAQRAGATEIRISDARPCTSCSCEHSATIPLDEVLGFIAHDIPAEPAARRGNVIPLRAQA